MRIHEKNCGYSMALFGEPRKSFTKKTRALIYVDCHILAIKTKEGIPVPYLNNNNLKMRVADLSNYTIRKMRSYARKLAEDSIKKTGWKVSFNHKGYIQNEFFMGFCFKVI